MSKRIWVAVLVLLTAGAFNIWGAQGDNQSRLKSLENNYVVSNKWFGFITDTESIRSIGTGSNSNRGDRFDLDVLKQNRSVTAEAIRKNVAEKGGKYALINALFIQRYMLLEPADKVAQFAGQQVWVTGTITTRALGKGGDTGTYSIKVTSITPHPIDSDWIY